MNRKIWVSSDHHLFHSNILKFTNNEGELIRPGFENVRRMNEYILECHNSLVNPNDIWYCLGDITMMYSDEFVELFKKFNGRKRLIVGNHDDIKKLAKMNLFQKIQMWRMFPEYEILLSHVPLHFSSLKRRPGDKMMLNVHGHVHQNDSPEGPYYNVSLEYTNYFPINIEEIVLTDGFGSAWYNNCFRCGLNGGLEIVRPGKVQCRHCVYPENNV